nr:diacylglycerol kinase family lipid kinase [Chitinophagaceae bacterium]
MRSFFFIVNTRIGQQRIQQIETLIQKYLPTSSCIVKKTEYGGHATVLAQEALLNSNNIVVAVGGDGTVNEIVQVLATTSTPLAIIPTGSGNGLARHCGIPLNTEQAVALLHNAQIVPIDLGRANATYFISNAGVGFDALVCHAIQETKSRGLKMYIINVIKKYFRYKKDEYTLISDERTFQQKAFFLNIANGKEFGYGFQIAPLASMQDGLLDVVLVKNMNVAAGVRFVIDGWRQRLHINNNCICFSVKKIIIEGKRLQYFQTDGDAHTCNGRCEIEIIKDGVQLLVPQLTQNL